MIMTRETKENMIPPTTPPINVAEGPCVAWPGGPEAIVEVGVCATAGKVTGDVVTESTKSFDCESDTVDALEMGWEGVVEKEVSWSVDATTNGEVASEAVVAITIDCNGTPGGNRGRSLEERGGAGEAGCAEICGAEETDGGESGVPEEERGGDVVEVVGSEGRGRRGSDKVGMCIDGMEMGDIDVGVSIKLDRLGSVGTDIRLWSFVDIRQTGINNCGQIGETLLGLGVDYILLLLRYVWASKGKPD
jgi:hypothetical protein